MLKMYGAFLLDNPFSVKVSNAKISVQSFCSVKLNFLIERSILSSATFNAEACFSRL